MVLLRCVLKLYVSMPSTVAVVPRPGCSVPTILLRPHFIPLSHLYYSPCSICRKSPYVGSFRLWVFSKAASGGPLTPLRFMNDRGAKTSEVFPGVGCVLSPQSNVGD